MKTLHRQAMHWIRGLVVLVLLVLAWQAIAADAPRVRITYLYDNTVAVAGTRAGWGFAALVERDGRRVLFDTGGDAAVLRDNVAALGVDLSRLDALVISHEHWDHTRGLPVLGARHGLPTYYPASADAAAPWVSELERAGLQRRPISALTEVVPGIWASAEMKSPLAPEIALAIDTDDGLLVLVGCSHPGADRMLQDIRQGTGRPVLLLAGGLHLLQSSVPETERTLASIADQGVRHLGTTHCSGDIAIGMARRLWGDRFVEGGVGTVLEVAPLRRTTVR
jgi:7,8-dihydropterin-6-yl-methyl-4-(beta-D-ribofuranosyl)aminobenzene 5'-phosphate synthase